MNFPSQLSGLSPIPDFLNYNCDRDSELSTEQLYENIARLANPILAWKLIGLDYVYLAGYLLLSIDKGTYIVNFHVPNKHINPAKCPIDRYRFIIFDISLNFTKNDQHEDSHSEAIIIDTLYQTIEFFEPYSSFAPWYDSVSNFLKIQFLTVLPKYRFKHTFDFCPHYGLQYKIDLPICGSITILFVLLRVNNQNLTSWDIMKLLTDLSKPSLIYLMRQFICYAQDFAKKNELRRLQNAHYFISKLLVNKPESLEYIDNLYHNLDFSGLARFVKESPLLEIRSGKIALK